MNKELFDASTVSALDTQSEQKGRRRAEREEIRRKFGFKLGKYARAIERVTVRFTDVNIPRGGIDQLCRIKAVLIGLPSVVVEANMTRPVQLHKAALAGTDRAVRRRLLQRRRKKPTRNARARQGLVKP